MSADEACRFSWQRGSPCSASQCVLETRSVALRCAGLLQVCQLQIPLRTVQFCAPWKSCLQQISALEPDEKRLKMVRQFSSSQNYLILRHCFGQHSFLCTQRNCRKSYLCKFRARTLAASSCLTRAAYPAYGSTRNF